MSLRQQVFKFLDNNDVSNVKGVYKAFPDNIQTTLKIYYHMWKRENYSNLLCIELVKINPIEEMIRSIQQIKDPVKRCENLSRLHAMMLKPLPNKEQKSLKELLNAQ